VTVGLLATAWSGSDTLVLTAVIVLSYVAAGVGHWLGGKRRKP